MCGIRHGNSTHFYRKDILGNIVAILDANGEIVAKYTYDAWGNHSITDTNGNVITDENHIANLNPFRYRSYYYDIGIGLYFLKTRYYDPEIGRFMTIDDISYLDPESINGLNLYAYCGNNPVMCVDPSGHWSIPNWLKFTIGIFAIAASIAISVVTLGTATPVLVGLTIGATVGAGFEIGSQIITNGSVNNWAAVGWAAFGGAVAGAISGISISSFSGYNFIGYLGTGIQSGTASVVGGIVSGDIESMQAMASAFVVSAFASVIAKGLQHWRINHTTNSLVNISNNKSRSIAINNYLMKNNIKPFGFPHNSFGNWSVNMFKNASSAFVKDVVIHSTQTSTMIYSSIVSDSLSSILSIWF